MSTAFVCYKNSDFLFDWTTLWVTHHSQNLLIHSMQKSFCYFFYSQMTLLDVVSVTNIRVALTSDQLFGTAWAFVVNAGKNGNNFCRIQYILSDRNSPFRVGNRKWERWTRLRLPFFHLSRTFILTCLKVIFSPKHTLLVSRQLTTFSHFLTDIFVELEIIRFRFVSMSTLIFICFHCWDFRNVPLSSENEKSNNPSHFVLWALLGHFEALRQRQLSCEEKHQVDSILRRFICFNSNSEDEQRIPSINKIRHIVDWRKGVGDSTHRFLRANVNE